eukprot:PhM_4_TR17557/c0_g1_i1/m.34152
MLHRTSLSRVSQATRLGSKRPWTDFWGYEKNPVYPKSTCDHPNPRIAQRYRKSHREWERHHGFGSAPQTQGELKEVPDWEFADGTPAPVTRTQYHAEHYKNKLLFQLIRAGATVEQRAAAGTLPKIPATKEQRDWDPNVPLFLEDVDEAGVSPAATSTTLDLDEINDIKMKPASFLFDRRKQFVTRELLVPRVPVGKRVMKEDWKPKAQKY